MQYLPETIWESRACALSTTKLLCCSTVLEHVLSLLPTTHARPASACEFGDHAVSLAENSPVFETLNGWLAMPLGCSVPLKVSDWLLDGVVMPLQLSEPSDKISTPHAATKARRVRIQRL